MLGLAYQSLSDRRTDGAAFLSALAQMVTDPSHCLFPISQPAIVTVKSRIEPNASSKFTNLLRDNVQLDGSKKQHCWFLQLQTS
jgi:hypothetical protein